MLPLLLLIITSCRTHNNKSVNNTNCKDVKQIIEKIWSYDDKYQVYLIKDEDIPIFNEYKVCLYGKTEDIIVSILGEPNKKHNYTLTYYISTFCVQKPQKYCKEYNVFIDKNTKKVLKIHGSEYHVRY